MATNGKSPIASPSRNNHNTGKWKWAAAIALVGIAILFGSYLQTHISRRELLDWVDQLGFWGPAFFILGYSIAAILFVPGSFLTLAAGAFFGVIRGSIYVSIASTLGATGAFLVGRFLARDWVTRKIAANPRFTEMDQAIANDGWKIVGLMRLSPIFPFTLLNYALGLTRIPLRDYILTSWIGMMPGTIMYVYLGSLAQAGTNPRNRTAGEWGIYGVGFFATLALTLWFTRLARRALAKRIDPRTKN